MFTSVGFWKFLLHIVDAPTLITGTTGRFCCWWSTLCKVCTFLDCVMYWFILIAISDTQIYDLKHGHAAHLLRNPVPHLSHGCTTIYWQIYELHNFKFLTLGHCSWLRIMFIDALSKSWALGGLVLIVVTLVEYGKSSVPDLESNLRWYKGNGDRGRF